MASETDKRVTAGPFTLVMPANGRETLYEADQGGDDHEVPFGTYGFKDALRHFGGEIIYLRAKLETQAMAAQEIERLKAALTKTQPFIEMACEWDLVTEIHNAMRPIGDRSE